MLALRSTHANVRPPSIGSLTSWSKAPTARNLPRFLGTSVHALKPFDQRTRTRPHLHSCAHPTKQKRATRNRAARFADLMYAGSAAGANMIG